MKIASKYKTVYAFLAIVLLGGFLMYTAGMFFLNLSIPPEFLLEHASEVPEQAELRLTLVKLLGNIYGVVRAIYVCGGILYLGCFWKSNTKLPVWDVLFGFLLIIIGMAIILTPFMIFDASWRADYLFSLRDILSRHCIIFSVLLFMNHVKTEVCV